MMGYMCIRDSNHDYEWILLVDIPAERYEYSFSGRNSMIGSGMQGVFSELVRLRSETVVHPDDVEAVSYTHLDVYKRQIRGWARAPADT